MLFFFFVFVVVFDCNTEVMLFLVCSLLRELQEYCSVHYACPVKFSVNVVSLKLWTLLIALFLVNQVNSLPSLFKKH